MSSGGKGGFSVTIRRGAHPHEIKRTVANRHGQHLKPSKRGVLVLKNNRTPLASSKRRSVELLSEESCFVNGLGVYDYAHTR